MGEAGVEHQGDDARASDGNGDAERSQAYLRAFELLVEVQSPSPGAVAAIYDLLTEAQQREWPEVVRAAMFAATAAPGDGQYASQLAATQRLLVQAEQDGASAMTALALAMRASRMSTEEDPQIALTADEDLARATVILESLDGEVMERISAHNACAQAYSDRWLWELADEQYAAALKLAPEPPIAWARFVIPAIIYNRAEMQVSWACVQRQLADEEALSERWRVWETVMAAATTVEMPPEWSIELHALGALLGAVAGRDTTEDARAQLSVLAPEKHIGAWPVGWLHLALALCEHRSGHAGQASLQVETAITEIDPRASPEPFDLALWLAAEIESKGRPTAAQRFVRRQLSLRWAHRLSVLGSTVGRIQAERLRREHDAVTQQLHLDDLTGLLNRRGFARYLESADRQGVERLSLLVADLDRFKLVNDRYGHQVGDTVLVIVGRLLQASVRQTDCAVRLGGDEFAVVLASAGVGVAQRRADAIVAAVQSEPWQDVAPGLAISISVGIAEGRPAEFSALMEHADQALYDAKARGRGSVVTYDTQDEQAASGSAVG